MVKAVDNPGKVCLDENTIIDVRPSGLDVGGRITEVEINASTWTALPANPLTGRQALAIQNLSGVEVKINYDDEAAGYVGMAIPDDGERQYDVGSGVVIYAKSSSGTVTINVEELA